MERKDRREIRQSPSNKTLRYYHLMYAIALSVIAVISIISQILIQSYLNHQHHDSHLINYAARLRTNSQQLTKQALLIESGRGFDTHRKDFKTILAQWQLTHESLLEGNEFLSLPANKNEDMAELFKIIHGPYTEIIEAGKKMVDVMYSERTIDLAELDEYIDIILRNEQAYLLGMEMIVFDYDRISRGNVESLKRVERALLFIVLFLLLLEAMFIFRPLANRIKFTFNNLIQSEKNATSLANKLGQTNSVLEQSHKDLRDINHTLDKATYLVKTDAKGGIIYANDKYCHVTKYQVSTLVGKPVFYNNIGEEENVIYQHIRDPLRSREVWQGEIFDHASDGTGFWLEITMMPIINSTGELYQYLIIGFDITKRKKTERKLHFLMEDKIKRQEELQKIRSQSIIAGQEKERKRLATEVHDGIGQMLTSLRIHIELLEEKYPRFLEELSGVYQMIQSIVDESRRICAELQPSVLKDFGLKAAVSELVDNFKSRTELNIEYIDNFYMKELNAEIEIGIYRILQEAMNNIVKHARATKIFIHMESDAEYIYLEINDNGKGFYYNQESVFDEERANNTHGLRNMRERAELIGAHFELISREGEGTKIKMDVPVGEIEI